MTGTGEVIRTGIDIVEVDRIGRLISVQGERFLSRCFTEREIAECEGKPSRIQSYAGKFAAKEAVYKALGLGWKGVFSWKHISIEKMEGTPRVRLSGTLSGLESRFRVDISISHCRQFAVAVAVSSGT